MSTGRFALVTIMTVERTRCVGVTGRTIRRRTRCMVSRTSVRRSTPRAVSVTAFTICNWSDLSVAGLAVNTVSVGRSVMRILDITTVTTDTAGQRLHGGMAGSAINRAVGVAGSCMMWSFDLTLVTGQAIGQFTYVGMTLCTVARSRSRCIVVTILLRNEGMTGRAIAVGGDTLVALVTQTLGIKLRLMMTCRDIGTVT